LGLFLLLINLFRIIVNLVYVVFMPGNEDGKPRKARKIVVYSSFYVKYKTSGLIFQSGEATFGEEFRIIF
jgi:hypothetical protein